MWYTLSLWKLSISFFLFLYITSGTRIIFLRARKELLLFILRLMEALETCLVASYIQLDSRQMKLFRTSYQLSVLLGFCHILLDAVAFVSVMVSICVCSGAHSQSSWQFGSNFWGRACNQSFSLYTKCFTTYPWLYR